MNFKEFLKNAINPDKSHIGRRRLITVLGVVFMGFSLAFLIRCQFGTDPYTGMNLKASELLGWSFGNWQALLNTVMFILVLIFGRENIGLGTLCNMLLVGYCADFFGWLIDMIIPETAFAVLGIRIAVFVPAILVFVIAAALYMDADLGSGPYDALVFIISKKLLPKVPFAPIRIVYDVLFIVFALILGGKFYIGTLVMALLLGPAITLVGKKIQKFFA
ncbi:MAG: hypothetical protein MJ105_02575 [Lachnospiraceae bacterium]|nr:hypothetical protein [Lachnospiraceae bacterium]